ncbi:hypothetical protein B0H14DRAFT_2613588 [Mycena olivaceomarginata]|nr:hypothetical protein B0H14DRAFT_2613588 [Mycena olivaceomarginata]
MYPLLGGWSAACAVALQLVIMLYFHPLGLEISSDGGQGLTPSTWLFGLESHVGIILHRSPFTQRPIRVAFTSMPVSPAQGISHPGNEYSAIPIEMGMAIPPLDDRSPRPQVDKTTAAFTDVDNSFLHLMLFLQYGDFYISKSEKADK